MVRAARTVTGSHHDAEESASDAVEQVLCRGADDVDNLEAFMVTVARRRALDRLRSEARCRQRELGFASRQRDASEDVASEVTDRAEARWADAHARSLLSPHGYTALRLFADGKSVREIAADMGTSERAVEGHLRRARTAMRTALAKTLGVLGAAGILVRRGTATVGAPTALATAVLLAVSLAPGGRPGPQPARAPFPPSVTHDLPRGSSVTPESRTARQPNVTRPRAIGPGAAGSRRTREVMRVRTPMGGDVHVTRHDSGGSESGPVAVIQACLGDFEVSPDRIGCSGDSMRGPVV